MDEKIIIIIIIIIIEKLIQMSDYLYIQHLVYLILYIW